MVNPGGRPWTKSYFSFGFPLHFSKDLRNLEVVTARALQRVI